MSIERLEDCFLGNHPIRKVLVEVSNDQDGFYCDITDERLLEELGETGYLTIGPSIRNNCVLLLFGEKQWAIVKRRTEEIESSLPESLNGTSMLRYIFANVAKCDLSCRKLRIPGILADYIKLKPGSIAEIVVDKNGIYLAMETLINDESGNGEPTD